jgi:N-terminal domain of NWD NACHT-NTPase
LEGVFDDKYVSNISDISVTNFGIDSSKMPDTAYGQDYDSLDEIDNQISKDSMMRAQLEEIIINGRQQMSDAVNEISVDPSVRPVLLEKMIKQGREQRDHKKIKFHIGHREIVLEDQVAQAAELVLWGKPLVDEAVKPSVEGSLIWAGVCLILPLLTHPHLATQANESGFNYVTARMKFYIALEPRLLPENQQAAVVSEELKKAFQQNILSLYKHILEFQFESVLRFYKPSWKRILGDVRNQNAWDQMLSKVKEAKRISSATSRK